MDLKFLIALLLVLQSANSLIVDRKNVTNVKVSKAKKSVETLYSIENDYNKKGHYYPVENHGQSPGQPHEELETPDHADHHINSYNYAFSHSQGLQGPQIPHVKENHQYPMKPSQYLLEEHTLHTILASNPLLAALFLSQTLGIPPSASTIGFNSPQHLPINPYVSLLLSHYGRYIQPPSNRQQRGIYGYAAANNYHNNMPFGSYKIYEDAKK